MSEIKFKKAAPTPPAGLPELMTKLGVKPPAHDPIPYPENWAELTSDGKYACFKDQMLSTENRFFDSEDVARTYVRRTKRWLDVMDLKEPDRVPNLFQGSAVVADNAGITQVDVFYDGEKAAKAALKFQEDFQPEYGTAGPEMSGKMLDLLGVNIMRWPGSSRPGGLQDDTVFQYIEGEFMPAEEYDLLINNPEGYLLRTFYPRINDGLKGLSSLFNLFHSIEPAGAPVTLMNLGRGPVREALETLLKASDSLIEHMMPATLVEMKSTSGFGTPAVIGGMTKAPFDIIADTMRGTKGALLDMYRRPGKLLAACDALIPSAIQMATEAAMEMGVPFVFLPLHKGADGFMSNEQFEEFYWPSFKALLLGMIDVGLIPFAFAEGGYNQRLDIIADSGLPKGRTAWWFDQTDMKAAKEKIGSWACIGGNVPASLFATGTPQEMDDYCQQVIDICAPGGGFFLAPGATIDHAKPENIHAFINSTKKFGVY